MISMIFHTLCTRVFLSTMKMNHRKLSKRFRRPKANMQKLDKLYGTTTLGARGQVVIPAEARKDLALRPGDQLIVVGKFGKVIALLKSDQLTEFIDLIMDHVAGSGMEGKVKEHFAKIFGPLQNKHSNH